MSLSINGPPIGPPPIMVSRVELGGDSTDRNPGLHQEAATTAQVPSAPAEHSRPDPVDAHDEHTTVLVDYELAVVQRTGFELRHTTIDITEGGAPPTSDSLAVVFGDAQRGADFDGDGEVTIADAAYGRLPQWDGTRLQTLAMTGAMPVELVRQAYARLDE